MQRLKWLILLMLVALSAIAGSDVEHVAFQELPLLNQLPSRCVLSIFEDADGEMWFGTEDGLCRHNGYRVATYRTHPAKSGSSNGSKITAVAQSRSGDIWFVADMNLFRLDKRTGEILSIDAEALTPNKIYTVHGGPDGNMWVGTADALLRVSPQGKVLRRYRLEVDNKPLRPQAFLTDSRRRLWITLEGSGAAVWDAANDAWHQYPWPFKESSMRMIEDRSGRFFYLMRHMKGLLRFNPDAPTTETMYTELPVDSRGDERDASMIAMVQDNKSGNIWVTTANGLRVYAPAGNSLKPTEGVLPGQQRFQMLTQIIKDSNSNLWVGGYNVPSFAIILSDHIKTDSVSAIKKQSSHASTISKICCDDDPSMLWIFQERHRLYLYNRTTHTAECNIPGEFAATHNNVGAIRAMVKSRKAAGVWVAAAMEQTIYRLTHAGNSIAVADRIPFPNHTVNTLLESVDGRVWIGSQKGVWVYNPATHKFKNYIAGETVTDIKEASDGRVYVASQKSTDKSTITTWVEEKLLASVTLPGSCTALGVTPGDLWAGMSSGEIYRFHADISRRPPLLISQTCEYQPYGTIGGMISDRFGNLWIQSNQRICALNPRSMAVNEYFANDPQLNLFNFFQQSLTYTSEGDIIAGGTGGFAQFSPSHDFKCRFQPKPVIITSVKVNGESRPLPRNGSTLTLDHGSHSVEVEFTSPNLLYAHIQGYAYRLLPTDTVWHKLPTGENMLTLNNIPSGANTLQVKLLGRGADVPQMRALLGINKRSYAWGYLLALVGGGIAVASIILYRKRRSAPPTPADPSSDMSLAVEAPSATASSAPTLPASPASSSASSSSPNVSPELSDQLSEHIDPEIITEVNRLLEQNFGNADYGIAELSADMRISRMTLYRKIQHLTNQSPTDYLKSFRLQRAMKLLKDDRLTINEIAYATGFNSPSYFTRAFKTEFGMTPSQFRTS